MTLFGITGTTMITDAGFSAAGVTGSFPPAQPVIELLSTLTYPTEE